MSEVREDAVLKAARLGLDLVRPGPDELFVDLDTDDEREEFNERFDRKFMKLWPLATVRFTQSSSGTGHHHAYVTVPELSPLTDHERIALQAALGSDPFREMLAVFHGRAGYEHVSVFFEQPAAMAIANQPKGSK